MAGVTIGAVIFLIWVGGLVRMTGSGMGCPDWPKCFGQWVPPTHISQLPADYKVRFAVVGKEIADFDAYKTWVEYLNRLVGVLIGFFCIATFALSLPLKKTNPRAFWLSLLSLLTVVVQGGIGAVVVRTNLHTGTITLHMVIAILLVCLLISAYLTTVTPKLYESINNRKTQTTLILGLVVLVVAMVQIILGTQVRERIDELAILLGEQLRGTWLGEVGNVFEVHKLSSNLVLAAVIAWIIQGRPYYSTFEKVGVVSIVATLVMEMVLGLGMSVWGIPRWFQPFHLLGAVLLFLGAFSMWMWQVKIQRAQLQLKKKNTVPVL